ncbi:glycosyltransferase [Lacticaseibacillus pabuli]|uniref:Glycosyltransferase n=1 Tax=Lacticaseibacillus pabuli TaxID=3025672 RepID=A0ABY7WRW3_9LACO|nr:glycosyltransferase [Lacticaseibacillus sp. KACC 23028]WDF82534.1 glycosyltransferase [Lacticaseibacillus sp. KACC 23028]
MNYFVTSNIDELTSAIEKSIIQRRRLFLKLGQAVKIVTRQYDFAQGAVLAKLDLSDAVVNMFGYFQQLDRPVPASKINQLRRKISQMPFAGDTVTVDKKPRVVLHEQAGLINYVDYRDQFGFTDRRDYYFRNQLSYSEYFDDGGKLITRSYRNDSGAQILTYHYRGGEGNVPVLTLIQLDYEERGYQFDNEDQLFAFFLDHLVVADPAPVLFADRDDVAVQAFLAMQVPAKRIMMLHSIFTTNGKPDGDMFKNFEDAFRSPKSFTGFVAATKREVADVHARDVTIPGVAIPPSFVPDELVNAPRGTKHVPTRVIAVARVTPLKQLSHAIASVIAAHAKNPAVTLDIWGYEENWDNFNESRKLREQIASGDASDYIRLRGYQADLNEVYEEAGLLLLTSEYEGFSMAVLEALSHGVPVVSYDVNYGPAEMIENGVNGYLVDPSDQYNLQRRVTELMTHPERLEKLGQGAKTSVQKWSEDAIATRWSSFLKTLK